MTDVLDSWNVVEGGITFRVTIRRDDRAGRPEENGDVYDPDAMMHIGREAKMTPEEIDKDVQWARDAVKAWKKDRWQFAEIEVVPVISVGSAELVLNDAAQVLKGCDYGDIPNGEGGYTDTAQREYVYTAWVNDLIEQARESAVKEFERVKRELSA